MGAASCMADILVDWTNTQSEAKRANPCAMCHKEDEGQKSYKLKRQTL